MHIFAYLKKYHNTELVCDPSDPVVDENDFERRDWASLEFGHVEGKEEFPANMPEPRGHGFIMWMQIMHQIQFQGIQEQDCLYI